MLFLSLQIFDSYGIKRFPKPEFENGHVQPPVKTSEARADVFNYIDIFILIASLTLITWVILKKRSRKGVFWITVFSVVYFGFYRQGCICSVGSVQNVALALFNPGYSIPISAILFFIIPLVYTLFFGRTFCAGICPLGAIQDLVALRPVSIKSWLEKVLGIIPFIYLALAILYAATATDFIICRYDPFVGFFRLNASFMMFVLGAIFLLLGVFIARPYCRFLCPYSALLKLVSRFSRKHMTITPAECINCRLCEKSCPVGAINFPTTLKDKAGNEAGGNRFTLHLILVPAFVLIFGFMGSLIHENLASVNPDIRLARELKNGTNYGLENEEALEITAFKSSGKTLEQLNTSAAEIKHQFYVGSWILGGFVGLVIGLTLVSLTVFRFRKDYTPNKATCHSCSKCMDYCPVVDPKIKKHEG